MAVVDRRIQRTRKTLHEALMALVLEGPYDSITVQQILDRANVGRSTFYTHFQDKDELLMWGTQHLRATLSAAAAGARRICGGIAGAHHLFQPRNVRSCRRLPEDLPRAGEQRRLAACSSADSETYLQS